jgi:hypothetical protein
MLLHEQPGCWSLILSLSGKVLFSTHFVSDILGIPTASVIDNDIRGYIHIDDIPIFEGSIQQLMFSGFELECLIRFCHIGTGSYRFLELRVAPYYRDAEAVATRSVTCIVASGRLFPTLAVDVYQSLLDARVEEAQLLRQLEVCILNKSPAFSTHENSRWQQPVASQSTHFESTVWESATPKFDDAPIQALQQAESSRPRSPSTSGRSGEPKKKVCTPLRVSSHRE